VRVLGVDTSLRSSGIAVVEMQGSRRVAVRHGRIVNAASLPLSQCLHRIHEAVQDWIRETGPQVVAIEGIFFSRNARTAVRLGEARGVVIAVATGAGLPVYEYEPRKVKQAIVGHGNADKGQVQRMIAALLGLDAEPRPDEADALAIALCHLHHATRHAALAPSPI
jgi:crossover junction endodeoxyribonuclease RuvC